MNPVLDAARAYVARGWSVIPVPANTKRPMVEWKVYQTRLPTESELIEWFGNGLGNIAIVTGAISGITAIDLDGKQGEDTAKSLRAYLPDTLMHRSPHGWHIIYRYTPLLKTGAGLAPGLDVRSDGGCLVVPPSLIEGMAYTVVKDAPLAILPAPLMLLANRPPRTHPEGNDEAPRWVSDLLEHGAPEHQRNSQATRLAGYFHAKGHPEDIVLAIVRQFAMLCSPPMKEDEVLATVRSVGRYTSMAKSVGIDTPPQFEQRGQAYRYTWENGITVQMDRLHEDRDGVYAELTITCTIPGVPGQLHGPVRFNLTATLSRTTLVSYLNKRVELPEWAQFLEQACHLAVAMYRAGEPVQDLADHTKRLKSQWILWPFILTNQVNVLYGDGGTAKSTLALAIMASIQTGAPYLGRVPDSTLKGLYLDWEDDVDTHGERLGWICLEKAAPSILYRKMYGSLADQVDEIKRLVDLHQIGFLVVDSAMLACASEPEKAEGPIKLFNALRTLGVTILLIAHSNKEGGLYGNVTWRNLGRNVWETKKQQEPGEDSLKIGLFHRKSNSGKLERHQGYEICWTKESISFKSIEALDTPELAEGVGLTARIIDVLKQGPITAGELAETLGKTENLVGNCLRDHSGTRFLNLGGRPAKWGLLTNR